MWETADTAATGSGDRPALEAARRIGSEYAVTGSAVVLAADLQLTANVYETRSGRSLGRARIRGPVDSMMTLADELTREVLNVLLEESDEQIPSVDLARITTESLPAYKAFIRGEKHLRAGEAQAGIEDFRAAIGADSSFALPYARMAVLELWHERAEGTIRQAHELAEQLPQRDRRLIRALYVARIEGRTIQARDRLRRLSEEYPDDPAVWHSLGELVFHTFIPGGVFEAERAHARAVRLDPGHLGYYDHYVLSAFWPHRDSAMAADRIEEMPSSSWKPVFRLAHQLVFGRSDQRKRALTRLDTLTIPEPWVMFGPLEGMEDLALLDTVLRRLLARSTLPHRNAFREILVTNDFMRGRVNQMLQDVEFGRTGDSPLACHLAYGLSLDIPFPHLELEPRLDPARMDEGAGVDELKCAGIYLIERGREKRLSTLMDRIRKAGSTGGSTQPPVPAVLAELRGYRAWATGRLEEATEAWSRANASGHFGAIWRGDLHRERGRLELAEDWYRVAWEHPVAHQRLGRLYEEMNRPEQAAAAYERFITAWKEADRTLQPRVEQAMERLQALTGEPGRISS